MSTSNAAISEAFFTFLVTIFGRYHLHFDANFKFKFEEFRDNQPQNIRQACTDSHARKRRSHPQRL